MTKNTKEAEGNLPPPIQKYSHELPGMSSPGNKEQRALCAGYIRRQAEAYVDAEPNTRIAFRFGRTTYRCNATPEAVKALANRIEANRFKHGCFTKQGVEKPGTKAARIKPHTFNSPQKAFDNFCQSGEIDNAMAYAALTNLPVYFAKCGNRPEVIVSAREFTPGFVVGRLYDATKEGVTPSWSVTHLDTGLKVGSSLTCKTAKQAIAEFRRVPKEELERALEVHKASRGFQSTGAKLYHTRETHNDFRTMETKG